MVEKALCSELHSLGDEFILVMSSESPFTLKNELQEYQGDRIFYSVPSKYVWIAWWVAEAERRKYLEHLVSVYDNSLSSYALQHILDHSSAFSLEQIRNLFDHAYLCMLLCKDHSIDVSQFDETAISKTMLYQTVSKFILDRSKGEKWSCCIDLIVDLWFQVFLMMCFWICWRRRSQHFL